MLVLDPEWYGIEVTAADSGKEIVDRVVMMHILTEGEGDAVAAGVTPSWDRSYALLVRLSVGHS